MAKDDRLELGRYLIILLTNSGRMFRKLNFQ
jgi:hypothetical protein